jgi:hypothetical protein
MVCDHPFAPQRPFLRPHRIVQKLRAKHDRHHLIGNQTQPQPARNEIEHAVSPHILARLRVSRGLHQNE